MDACNGVEKEVDKVLSKFGGINDHADRTLSDLCNHIDGLKNGLDESSENHQLSAAQIIILKQAANKVRETVQRLATDHRDLHSTVSKVGKAIDRNFVSDFASTSREEVFSPPEKVQLLNKVICQHFYRQGMLDIAEEIAKEANMETETCSKEPFSELNNILDCLKQRNLGPALAWAIAHRESLADQNSSLEFKLHRLQFIGLVQQGIEQQAAAVSYARTHFTQFVARHDREIQSLMGSLLFLPQGLPSSPYSHLLDPHLWVEIHEVFMRDACALLGLSVDSPLSVCINAGCAALPALLNIKQVMQQRQIEIDLGKENRYHSVFACPILRQQSTENNPPMRLVCGHVISRDALNKLSSGNK
ncbi:hypothetical protein B566_EDAN007070 [Ephemera danica]|nr:hypothetical protein B566_EDAN007070 [Ephemera danica]